MKCTATSIYPTVSVVFLEFTAWAFFPSNNIIADNLRLEVRDARGTYRSGPSSVIAKSSWGNVLIQFSTSVGRWLVLAGCIGVVTWDEVGSLYRELPVFGVVILKLHESYHYISYIYSECAERLEHAAATKLYWQCVVTFVTF